MIFKNLNPVKVLFYILVTIVLLVATWFYLNVIAYFILSFFLAYFLNPAVKFFEKSGISRTYSIMIIYLILISIIVLSVIYLFPILVNQGKEFAVNTSKFLEKDGLQKLTNEFPKLKKIEVLITNLKSKLPFLDFDDFKLTITQKIKEFAIEIPNIIMDSISSLVTLFTFLLIVPVVGFLLLKDQDKMRKKFYEIIPNKYFELVIILMEKFDKLLGTYLRALLIQVMIIGTLVVTVLSIIGVKNSLIIGIFAGLANAIPYLGPVIGIIFAVISVIFSGKPLILVVWVIVSMLGVQLIDNIFVYPTIMGKNTELHPLIILLTVVAGSYAYGIIGMLVSVPLVFIIKEMITVLYTNLKGFKII
ncbi:MAG: AI-2E family transporter [Candidatus Cloacimonadota bacterium]|nr:AI-2E family transporter [Candidatus Cloacimonadota bacterium]